MTDPSSLELMQSLNGNKRNPETIEIKDEISFFVFHKRGRNEAVYPLAVGEGLDAELVLSDRPPSNSELFLGRVVSHRMYLLREGTARTEELHVMPDYFSLEGEIALWPKDVPKSRYNGQGYTEKTDPAIRTSETIFLLPETICLLPSEAG